MTLKLLQTLADEASRRLGHEIVARDGDVRGSPFNDVIVALGGVSSVKGGAGDDIIFLPFGSEPREPIRADGGFGADTYVVAGGTGFVPGDGDVISLVIDPISVAGGGVGARDQIVLTGFDPETTMVNDLGDGKVEAFDPDSGALAVFRVEQRDGTAVPLDVIADRITVAGTGQPNHTAEFVVDIDASGPSFYRGTWRSEIIFSDGTASLIEAGAGNDVIITTLSFSDSLAAGSFVVDGGRGADTYMLFFDTDQAEDEAEECLIFDLSLGGFTRTSRDTAVLPDFGPGTEVLSLDNGQFQFFDTATLLLRTVGFEWEDGQGLTAEELAGVLVGDDGFIYVDDGYGAPLG
jgi:hypothetical protein